MSDGVNFLQLPLWEDMDFAYDCDVWGNWMASCYLPNPWNKSETLGGTYLQAINLFNAASPAGISAIADEANLTLPETWSGISQWFTWHTYNTLDEDGVWGYSPEFYDTVIYEPYLQCTAEYCKSLGYTGNADLTGIGVYVSYYVEAVLATLYLIAYTTWHLRGHAKAKRRDRDANEALLKHSAREGDAGSGSKKTIKLNIGQRTLDSFRGSLDGFLTASMLMSIAMLIAAVWTSAAHVKSRKDPHGPQTVQFFGSSVYDMVLSLLAASFSVFPVMLLYALMGRRNDDGSKLDKKKVDEGRTDKHRVWLRRGVLGLMWALAAAEVYLAPRGEADYDERHDTTQLANIDPCNQRGGTSYWQALKAGQVLIIGAPILWIVLTGFVVTGFGIPGLAEKGWVSRWRSVWRLGIAWLNLLLMWSLLAYFTILRKRIIDTSGGIDDENQWGFGQLLALATWVPVAAEFIYIFIWGIEESLDTHMPTGFIATRVEDLSLFHAATLGLDPFQAEDDPFMGDKKSEPRASTMEMMPVQSAYQEGQTAPEVHVTGSGQQQQHMTPPYYDSSLGHQQQTPWQQWNNTGW